MMGGKMHSTVSRSSRHAAAAFALLCSGRPAHPLVRRTGRRAPLPFRQQDLTFWVNHNGLAQFDVLGEVGFGDMARILMRRRANDEAFRKLRDRFTFRVRELAAIDTPDLFRVEIGANGSNGATGPIGSPCAAGHTFNLPLIVTNSSGVAAKLAS